jgi:hypothetical protein
MQLHPPYDPDLTWIRVSPIRKESVTSFEAMYPPSAAVPVLRTTMAAMMFAPMLLIVATPQTEPVYRNQPVIQERKGPQSGPPRLKAQ